MNNALKKYVCLTLMLALLGTATGAGLISASADETEKSKTSVELCDMAEPLHTPDMAETTDCPFKDENSVTKLNQKGDLDSNKRITVKDATDALKISVGIEFSDTDSYIAADIDNNNRITVSDAIEILKKTCYPNIILDKNVIYNINWIQKQDGIYAYDSDRKPVTGIVIYSGYKCGFDENGKMYTGECEIDGVKYLFNDNGILISGWQYGEKGKSFYERGYSLKGWNTLYGNDYYFDDDGIAISSWQSIDGKTVYFKPDCVAAEGWQTIDGKSYYFYQDHTAASGFVLIEGRHYLLLENGGFVTGWQTVNGNNYYFTENGSAALGWTLVDGKKLYFPTETEFATGLYAINGVNYLFADDGTVLTGWQNVDGLNYYFKEDGAAPNGIYKVENTDYYFVNGILYTGWNTIDNKTYLMDEYGFVTKGWQIIDNNRYYFDNSGVMAVGEKKIDGSTYIFGSDGIMNTGWITENGKKSYINNFKKVTGEYTVDGKKYYFESDGVLYTGLCTIKGSVYYKNEYGFNQKGWQIINGAKYYFSSDGAGTNGFLTLDGIKYYFTNGKMAVNTTVGLYEIDSNGVCKRVTTISPNQAKYRADEIISSVGKDAYSLYAYVVNHFSYYFINEPQVYNNPQTAEWSRLAAYAMNRGYGACYHFAAYLDVLFRRAGYTTRIVVGTGFYTSLHCWNQIYVDGKWVNYDAVSHFYGVSDAFLKGKGFTFNQYVTAEY